MVAGSWRFTGRIAGIGTASGTRIVIGMWEDSPLASFTDVMVERPGGHRILLACREPVADFVSATYRFDEVRIVPVQEVNDDRTLRVTAGPLHVEARVGARTRLGWALHLLPGAVTAHPAFTRVSDPLARLLTPGVRTRGTAGSGRREHYGATDVHRIDSARVTWDGEDLGELRPLDPSPRFGFSSTPRQPSVTSIVTTVRVPASS